MASGHLRRRGGIYWFRRRVPADLAERLGRREVHLSLRTVSYAEASGRAKRAWLVTDRVFQTMKLNPKLAAAQARALIDQLLAEPLLTSETADALVTSITEDDRASLGHLLFNETAVHLVMALPPADREKIGIQMSRIVDRSELAVARRRQEWETTKAEAALLQARDAADQAKAAEARAADAEAQLAKSEVARQVAERLQQMTGTLPRPVAVEQQNVTAPPEATEDDMVSLPAAKGRGKSKAPLFSKVEAPFLADKRRGDGYSGQTTKQVESTFRLWVELIGDKAVNTYTGTDAGQFRDLVLRMPANHGKGARINAVDAIRAADRLETASGQPVPRLTMKTTKRHFSALSQLWEWLRPREHVERNIFRGFAFPNTKSSRRLRDDWSDEDLVKLFTSDWYGPDNHKLSALRWMPLIAMFSGLRLEEASRLRPTHDIVEVKGDVEVEGVLAFKIQEHPEPEPWNPKTEAGERVVPVHPVLIELGLMQLVERRRAEGEKRLFKEFRPMGPDLKYGADFSRRFGKHKTALGIGEKTVFHSFRHSVRTILGNTDIKDSWIDAVLGHEGTDHQSVGIAVYLKRIGIRNLKTVVESITYSDEVMAAVRHAMS